MKQSLSHTFRDVLYWISPNRKCVPSVTAPAGFGVHHMDGGCYGNEHASEVNQPITGLKAAPMMAEAQMAARNPEARPIRWSSKRRILAKTKECAHPNIHRDLGIPGSGKDRESEEGSADEAGPQIDVPLMSGLAE